MPKSYIGGFEKITKKKNRQWDQEDDSRRNDKYKNKRSPKLRDYNEEQNDSKKSHGDY